MRKVMIVSSVYGFLSKFEIQNVKLLQSLGYEVHYASNAGNVIYNQDEDCLEKLGVIYHEIGIYQSPYFIGKNIRAIKTLRRIIKEEQIEIVHCHTPTGGMVARMACKHLPVYVIYTAHGFHFYEGGGVCHNLIFYLIEKYLSRYTDAIVTINREDEKAAKSMHAKQVYRVPGVGIDRDRFGLTKQEERVKARRDLGIDEDTLFLLSVGELRENKNQMRILESLALMKERGDSLEDLVYGLVGNGRQGEAMRQYIIDNGLEKNVRFFGYQVDVKPYLNAADVLLFPSIREGFGMAAIEALSTGIPVIASDNRGSKEYIKSGENGYLVEMDTVEDYADAIEDFHDERDVWKKQNVRKSIRESTEQFGKIHTLQVMREVYEDAGGERTDISIQSRSTPVKKGDRVRLESDVS